MSALYDGDARDHRRCREQPVEKAPYGATMAKVSEGTGSIGGMTVAHSLVPTTFVGRPWMIEDLDALPDDGFRYEIFDGSLLVTPPPGMPHVRFTARLHRLLVLQAPDDVMVGEGAGVYPNDTNFYIPDIFVVPAAALEGEGRGFAPADLLLAVEVVSPSNPGNDLVLKRHAYAVAGIQEYWVVDRRDRTLRVLRLESPGKYADDIVVKAGEPWRADRPFPLAIDPADVF
jgi:Uma2 family endonuclease